MSEGKNFVGNEFFDLAVKFVNQTNQNIFVTGKAGTGKTTFLKHIREKCSKRMAIAAPTGVAAINAGGMTLHSLFWLPFGAYAEKHVVQWDAGNHLVNNRTTLFGALKLTRQRRRLIQELELLIIDEISMVRADTLDAIDTILKSVRKDQRPFGGLQMVLIGDLLQLPPVVKENEWQILKNYYQSPYFFHANVILQNPLVNIEFQTIYRQSDSQFIDILNSIRSNRIEKSKLDLLNEYWDPDFTPTEKDNYITLTSHNRLAEKINQEALNALSAPLKEMKAAVSKDFPESLFPVEMTLHLKEGAQVMFIKNDSGEERKFYNGKIGYIKKINNLEKTVLVAFTNGDEDVEVRRETWENTKYKYDEKEAKIETEVIGTFSQYPLRLAWAITIHKSQGLTFERAVVDAGTSFAAGQVYVALSRLTSLDGLKLKSRINAHSIHVDQRVASYLAQLGDTDQLNEYLIHAQKKHLQEILIHIFNWRGIQASFKELQEGVLKMNIASKAEAVRYLNEVDSEVLKINDVANKFMTQLYTIFRQGEDIDYTLLMSRVKAAVEWFDPKVNKLIFGLAKHIQEFQIKKSTKKYVESLVSFLDLLKKKNNSFKQGVQISNALSNGEVTIELLEDVDTEETKIDVKKVTQSKKNTKEISLELFQSGQNIGDIAESRGMVYDTIFNHLVDFLGEGIEIEDLLEKNKLDEIMKMISEYPDKKMTELKHLLDDDIEYREIRVALKWNEMQKV